MLDIKDYEQYNHLHRKSTLRNTYYLLRHGESTANVAWMFHNTEEADDRAPVFLTSLGETQIRQSMEEFSRKEISKEALLVISSPLKRTQQTADILCQGLGLEGHHIDKRIIERNCGDYENTRITKEIAAEMDQFDEIDPFHSHRQMESPMSVTKRTTHLIEELEMTYTGITIILVTHYHTATMLMNACEGVHPGKTRDIANGEFYKLKLAIDLTLDRTTPYTPDRFFIDEAAYSSLHRSEQPTFSP